MTFTSPLSPSAVADFHRARRQAALQAIVARLTGRSVELLSYDDVSKKLRPIGSADRGLREIPLDAIVGSVGRYADFTQTFLPRHDSDAQRWAKVKTAMREQGLSALPPIEVYQIGETYFVKDGNHRVSVARQEGLAYLHAYVTEVRTRVPLAPDVQPDDLIIQTEQAAFLEYTRLDELRPGADLSVSVPGQQARLENHIEAHRYLKEVEQEREVPFEEAACSWYDEVYLPVVQTIREQGILRYFPNRTETDLYLWMSEHYAALQRELGWQIKLETVAAKLAVQIRHDPERADSRTLDATLAGVLKSRRATGQWRMEKLIDRYGDRLFADILVALSGRPEGWPALDQALEIARREGAQVHGLHLVATEAQQRDDEAQVIRAEFQRRCETAGIAGQLGIEAGDITPRICERAVMADLVVLALAHPPASQPIARLGSKIRTLVQRCPRQVLFVPGAATSPNRALLAYDGSSKAREALFAAAYLAERFKTSLVVVSVMDGHIAQDALDFARRYLELHEAQAIFVQIGGPVAEAILKAADEHRADLLIMGGYGSNPIRQVVLGSSVEQALRESNRPVLICR